MAIIKNTAGQGLYVYAHDTAADAAKTGDAANITATISKDGAAAVATNDTNPTEIGGGVYWFDLTQAETNAGVLALIPVSATSGVVLDPVLVVTDDATISSRASASDLATVDGIVDALALVAPDNKPTVAATGEASANVTLWKGATAPDAPPTAAAVADAVWDEALSGHLAAGSTGAALSAAGDPWSVELPGSYLSDQAGGIIGRLAEIDTTAVTATVSSLAGHLAIVAARTFAATVSGLTIPSDWAAAIWTLKTSASEADDAALVRLRASNPSDLEADGLERLNGAALSGLIQASDGSLTVDQAGGSVAIWLSDELTALLAETTGLGWDVKFIDDDDDSSGVRGTADVALTETWLTA